MALADSEREGWICVVGMMVMCVKGVGEGRETADRDSMTVKLIGKAAWDELVLSIV